MNANKTADELISAYFKAELPHTWLPAPGTTAEPMTMPVASRFARNSQSRLVLAVSILVLLAGSWFLTGQISRSPERTAKFDGTTATRPADIRLGK